MAIPDDIALSNISCRIVVLSSAIAQTISFIHLVQNRNGVQSASIPTESSNETIPASDPVGSSSGLIKIPWTITNRYYSAPVHFAAHAIHGLSPHQIRNIPAVIFVWAQGESYKHHVERIHQDLAECEPEVCLAVRIPQDSSVPFEAEDEPEDDSEIDAFLSSHGFEYIDVTQAQPITVSDDIQASGAFEEGIPGLPRVLDALSTIMWSSMQTRSKDAVSLKADQLKGRALLDWAQSSQDDSLLAAEGSMEDSDIRQTGSSRNTAREMRELARWLEEDESLREDPWKSAASSGAVSTSPTAMEFERKTPKESSEQIKIGFDDDFTVFVSAPAVDLVKTSGRSTPDANADGLSTSLSIPHAGDLYRSLGSVSDFGGSDDGKDVEDFEEDSLPSQEEVLATSSRIFGVSKVPLPPIMESRTATIKPGDSPPTEASPKASADPLPGQLLSQFGGGDDSYDLAPFDLSRVLGALQEMKAEIANMEDEGERRKAAAKVALGLVYGLEADAEL